MLFNAFIVQTLKLALCTHIYLMIRRFLQIFSVFEGPAPGIAGEDNGSWKSKNRKRFFLHFVMMYTISIYLIEWFFVSYEALSITFSKT